MTEWNGENYFTNTVHFHKVYRKFCQNAVKEYHFTPGEIDVMTFLSNNPGMDTAAAICQCKNISKPLVCRCADSLTRQGFLCPAADENDRRIVHLHLTEKASEVSRRLRWCRSEFFRRLIDGVTPEQLSTVQEVLLLMRDNLYHLPEPDGCPADFQDTSNRTAAEETDKKEGISYES